MFYCHLCVSSTKKCNLKINEFCLKMTKGKMREKGSDFTCILKSIYDVENEKCARNKNVDDDFLECVRVLIYRRTSFKKRLNANVCWKFRSHGFENVYWDGLVVLLMIIIMISMDVLVSSFFSMCFRDCFVLWSSDSVSTSSIVALEPNSEKSHPHKFLWTLHYPGVWMRHMKGVAR